MYAQGMRKLDWRSVGRALGVLVATALTGCATTTTPEPHTQPAPSDDPQGAQVQDAAPLPTERWAEVALQTLGLGLRLPDPTGWKAHPQASSWHASHQATRTELTLRTWQGVRAEGVAGCWRELTQRTAAPLGKGAIVVFDEPRQHATFLGRAVARTQSEGDEVRGSAQVVFSSAGRCVALLGETAAKGPDAAAVVGSRLAIVTEGIGGSLDWLTPEERVLEPAPLTE